jgi:hypothetical protein
MVTSRSVPQHSAQMVSALAGQNRFGLRFRQIGQGKITPRDRAPAAAQPVPQLTAIRSPRDQRRHYATFPAEVVTPTICKLVGAIHKGGATRAIFGPLDGRQESIHQHPIKVRASAASKFFDRFGK